MSLAYDIAVFGGKHHVTKKKRKSEQHSADSVIRTSDTGRETSCGLHDNGHGGTHDVHAY